MTGLIDDLTEITDRYGNAQDDMLASVPIGAIRAARAMLERYEAWPLVDRPLHPHYVDMATTPRRGGGKNQALCIAQRARRQRERGNA